MVLILLEYIWLQFRQFFYDLRWLFWAIVKRPQKSVEGTVILITGAGHGLGRGLALQFAKRGAKLVLWDLNEKGNKETQKAITDAGGIAHAYTVDVTDKEKVYSTAKQVKRDVGVVEILFNNAGVLMGQSILDLTDEQIEVTLKVNTLAHFWTIRSFLPDMIDQGKGHIVTIASLAGHLGTRYLTDYTASKFGAVGLDDALDDEIRNVFKQPNIKLTCVCPYYINTGLIDNFYSRIMPTLEEEHVVEVITDGVLRNYRFIYIPKIFHFLLFMRKTRCQDSLAAADEFAGFGIHPQKRKV